jgi:DNA-binding transcriptional regulator YiaG
MKSLSLEEFKERIAQIVHAGQSAWVAKKTNPLLVRKLTDRGYKSVESDRGNAVFFAATMNISAELKLWRSRNHLTQREAAEILGVPYKTFVDWEQERRGPKELAYQTIRQRMDSYPGGRLAGALERVTDQNASAPTRQRASTRASKKRVNEKTKRKSRSICSPHTARSHRPRQKGRR